jgi:hypothetical protein
MPPELPTYSLKSRKADAEYHSDDHILETILELVTGEHEKDKSIIRGKEKWSGICCVNSDDIQVAIL